MNLPITMWGSWIHFVGMVPSLFSMAVATHSCHLKQIHEPLQQYLGLRCLCVCGDDDDGVYVEIMSLVCLTITKLGSWSRWLDMVHWLFSMVLEERSCHLKRIHEPPQKYLHPQYLCVCGGVYVVIMRVYQAITKLDSWIHFMDMVPLLFSMAEAAHSYQRMQIHEPLRLFLHLQCLCVCGDVYVEQGFVVLEHRRLFCLHQGQLAVGMLDNLDPSCLRDLKNEWV